MTQAISMPVNVPQVDWDALTLGQRIQHLEVEGYVVLPKMLAPPQVQQLRGEIQHRLKTRDSEPTPLKKVAHDIQFAGGALTELIAHPPMIAFLKRLFGEELIMMTYDYSTATSPTAPVRCARCWELHIGRRGRDRATQWRSGAPRSWRRRRRTSAP